MNETVRVTKYIEGNLEQHHGIQILEFNQLFLYITSFHSWLKVES